MMKNCKFCASTDMREFDKDILDSEYGAPGSYSYWRCGQCGLLQIDPLPDETILCQAYPFSYHAYHEHQSRLARFLKQRYWHKKAKRYSQYIAKESSILELGCSFGDLLDAFRKRGFRNLKGLDYNPEAVKKGRDRGLDVVTGELTYGMFRDEIFKMIVMENFIEHVYDPAETLRICHSLLSPGGILVGETPNTDQWDHRLFRKYWGGYHAPRHIYLFNSTNLALLAKQCGFRLRTVRNILQPAHWALSIQNLIQNSRFKGHLKNGRSPYFAILLLFMLPLNMLQQLVSKTSLMEFVLEKES